MPLGRPFRAILVLPSSPQGVALGYHMPPPWGFRQALKGRNVVTQGNPLGKRPPTIIALKGRPERVHLLPINRNAPLGTPANFNTQPQEVYLERIFMRLTELTHFRYQRPTRACPGPNLRVTVDI